MENIKEILLNMLDDMDSTETVTIIVNNSLTKDNLKAFIANQIYYSYLDSNEDYDRDKYVSEYKEFGYICLVENSNVFGEYIVIINQNSQVDEIPFMSIIFKENLNKYNIEEIKEDLFKSLMKIINNVLGLGGSIR